MTERPIVVVFDPDLLTGEDRVAALDAGGFLTSATADPSAAIDAIRRDGAALVLVGCDAGTGGHGPLRDAARGRGIPVVRLADRGSGRVAQADDVGPADTLSDRLVRILNAPSRSREETTPIKTPIPLDTRLLATIVHDIRNPLNVIGLTLKVLEQMPPQVRDEIEEDLIYLRENATQIERMLALLSDLCRITDKPPAPYPTPFEPARFLDEVVAERSNKSKEKAWPARIECDPSPAVVVLDPLRARLALKCALTHVAGAADRPITVRSSSSDDRWQIRLIVDRPPPPPVQPKDVGFDAYERLIATAAERRGLDLAMAAALSHEIGGSVRIEVEPNSHSAVVLDWPVTMA